MYNLFSDLRTLELSQRILSFVMLMAVVVLSVSQVFLPEIDGFSQAEQ